jgi:hypothetical protein
LARPAPHNAGLFFVLVSSSARAPIDNETTSIAAKIALLVLPSPGEHWRNNNRSRPAPSRFPGDTLMHPSSSPSTGRSKAAAVFRVTAGNFLEQFDFFLFGFYATQIAAVFFPAASEFASLMLTFAVFGAGFLMRPLGAIVLGAYIDDVGRRKGLIVTLSIMASGTMLIAFVPGYATIGVLAPCWCCRAAAAGLLGGAELGGVSVYLAEMATPGRKGFYTSWQSASQQVAIVVAAALGFALNHCSHVGHRRVGLARSVLRRLHDRAVHLHAAPLAAGNAGVHRAPASPGHAEVFATLARNWGVVIAGMMLVAMTTTSVLPDHRLHADLRQDGAAPEHRRQPARDAVRRRVELRVAADRRRAVGPHRPPPAARRHDAAGDRHRVSGAVAARSRAVVHQHAARAAVAVVHVRHLQRRDGRRADGSDAGRSARRGLLAPTASPPPCSAASRRRSRPR